MHLCPFNMHDKTAWLQPYPKTFIQKKKKSYKRKYSQRSGLHKKDIYGYSKKPEQGLLEWTQEC